jgi:hypothetical protein
VTDVDLLPIALVDTLATADVDLLITVSHRLDSLESFFKLYCWHATSKVCEFLLP